MIETISCNIRFYITSINDTITQINKSYILDYSLIEDIFKLNGSSVGEDFAEKFNIFLNNNKHKENKNNCIFNDVLYLLLYLTKKEKRYKVHFKKNERNYNENLKIMSSKDSIKILNILKFRLKENSASEFLYKLQEKLELNYNDGNFFGESIEAKEDIETFIKLETYKSILGEM